MSSTLFLALAILGGGSYDSRPVTVDTFHVETYYEEYKIVGELQGVRVSCTENREKCLASNGVAIELLTKVKHNESLRNQD